MIHEWQTKEQGNKNKWFDYLIMILLIYVTLFAGPL